MKILYDSHVMARYIVLLLSLIGAANIQAAGLMSPKNQSLADLEIRQHMVTVTIENGYAITSVEQVFFNPHSNDLEALYSFPIPEKAAVSEFTYWIDGTAVTGEVLAKEKARAIYQEEKQAGRETALTEQDEFKTFDVAVYPVRSQQEVRIKLRYIQPVHVDTSIGRFVYPLENGGVDQEKLSFWTYNDKVTEKFSFDLHFRSSYPVDTFYLPKHPHAQIVQVSDTQWHVSLASDSSNEIRTQDLNANEVSNENHTQHKSTTRTLATLDTDIVVYWRHKAGLPGRVDLITHRAKGSDKGTFMMTVTPGEDLAPISDGRDWIFVLDYSGSMKGKYQSMINGVKKGLSRLNPQDRFRIFIFSTNAQEVTQNYLAASPENVQRTMALLEKHSPNGSTNLYQGLSMGTHALDADRSSAIILVTDGVANVGVTEKKSFLTLMKEHDVRLFTFVMGNSANRPLLEGMTKISNGFAISISNSDEIGGKMLEATSKLSHQALHDLKLSFSGIKVSDLSQQEITSLYRGQQLTVFGHYWGEENKPRQRASVSIEGKIGDSVKRYSATFDFPTNGNLHPELERLWAYATIEKLENSMDYLGKDADTEQAITDIAVEYGLVTNYTSLLAIRDEAFENRGIKRRNKARNSNEKNAQEARRNMPTSNNRVDQSTPMYNKPAPNYSGGGGAAEPIAVLLLLPLMLLSLQRRKRHRAEHSVKN